MPQVAVKVSFRGLGPLLGRTAARTLRPALARTAKQPYARSASHPPAPSPSAIALRAKVGQAVGWSGRGV